ncbi:hypothetical protein KY321_04730 [Candidatus Woesearchaeota archaeon]|nr:hypothetical protein [Candidatus Woesearchaeota archaeon]
MKNKRGLVYSFGIVLISLIVIVAAIVFHVQNKNPVDLGRVQSGILETYQQSQINQLKTELKAKLSAVNTIYNLAQNSGFVKSKCGNYYGVPLLSYKNRDGEYAFCNSNFAEQFEIRFKEEFEGKQNNYLYFTNKNNDSLEIRGIAKKSTSLNFNEQKDYRVYSYKDAFSNGLDYNFYVYDYLIPNFLNELNEHCSDVENNKISNYLDRCVEGFLKNYNSKNGLSNSIFEIKFDDEVLKDRELSVIQKIKNLEESNFQYCYHDVGKEFKRIDYASTDINIRFINDDGLNSSDIYFQRKENLEEDSNTFGTRTNSFVSLSYSDKVLVDYAFYKGVFRNGVILPLDLKKSTYAYNYNKNELLHQSARSIEEAHGVDLFKCDRENEKSVCLLSSDVVFSNENFLKQRLCEFENRKYVFRIDDNEYYPEKGPLVYKFSTYVEDKVKPEFRKQNMIVQPKDFAEDVVLIRFPHSKSNDITTYDIFLNDNLIKKIKPWVGINIYDEIDWSYGNKQKENVLDSCQVEKEGSYYQCYNSFNGGGGLFEEGKTYFFKNNNEFVHVLDLSEYNLQKNEIKIRYNDDDLNYEEEEIKKIELQDRLPLLPLKYGLYLDGKTYSSLITRASSGDNPTYFLVTYSAVPVSQNMDGSIDSDESGNLLIYYRDVTDFSDLDKTIQSTTVRTPVSASQYVGQHTLYSNAYFVMQQEDESMKYLDSIPVELYGHKKVLINMQSPGSPVNTPASS